MSQNQDQNMDTSYTRRSVKSKDTPVVGTHSRSLVIERTKTTDRGRGNRLSTGGYGGGYGGGFGGGFQSSSRVSMGSMGGMGGGAMVPEVIQSFQSAKDRNEKEKKNMQQCNNRLASMMEKLRYQQAVIDTLTAQLENSKKWKGLDRTPFEEELKVELQGYKDKLENEAKEKAELMAQLALLEDEKSDWKELNDALEKDIEGLRNEIRKLCQQLGDCEGENNTLRKQLQDAEDEISRLKKNMAIVQGQLKDARQDLTHETEQRIQAQLEMCCVKDESVFKEKALGDENEKLKELLKQDTSQIDLKNVWKGQIQKCIKDIQDDNERMLDEIKCDYNARYEAQVSQLQAGQLKDNAEVVRLQSEISRLKSRTSDDGGNRAELEREINRLRKEIDRLNDELGEVRENWQSEVFEKDNDIRGLNANMSELVQRFKELADEKLTLETEICCYRKLLEGEEESMRRMMEDVSGARSQGANELADMVQQSMASGSYSMSSGSSMSFGSGGYGGGSGGYGDGSGGGFSQSSGGFSQSSGGFSQSGGGFMQQSGDSSGFGGGGMSISTEGKVLIRKKATGPIALEEAHGGGFYVTISYSTTKDKKNLGDVDLQGWRVIRTFDGESSPWASFVFQKECILQPNTKIRILSKVYAKKKDTNVLPTDLIAECDTWRSGSGKFVLEDKQKNEKASLTMEYK